MCGGLVFLVRLHIRIYMYVYLYTLGLESVQHAVSYWREAMIKLQQEPEVYPYTLLLLQNEIFEAKFFLL